MHTHCQTLRRWYMKFHSTLGTYHQIPISGDDQKYTAFEADGGLWEFTCMTFGVTNGVSKFQHNIDSIVEKEGLPATFPFLDNVTVCGHTEQELKENEAQFRSVAKKYNLTLNESKSVVCVQSLPILGYLVSHGEIKPDRERLLPLKNLVAPCDLDSQRRIVVCSHIIEDGYLSTLRRFAHLTPIGLFHFLQKPSKHFNH